MTLYESLNNIVEGKHDGLVRIAYSVIHKSCKLIPDLKRHYPDMEQSIYEEWLLADVDDQYTTAQIVRYAQHKARYTIQKHLMQFNIIVNVPKKISEGRLDFTELDYSNINFDQEATFDNQDESADEWLKSVHFLTIDRKDSWLIWYLSEGFSISQASAAMGVQRATIYSRLNNIKERHLNA
jgi:hypothetical protein